MFEISVIFQNFYKSKRSFSHIQGVVIVSEEEITLDYSKFTGFFKKNKKLSLVIMFIILLGIPMYASVYLRSQTYDLPVLDRRAEEVVINNIQNSIASSIRQQFPNLPDQNLEAKVNEQLYEFISGNEEDIKIQIDTIATSFKSRVQDDNGQTYLLAIDPYHFYQFAKNYVNNGHMGEKKVDGKSWNALMRGRRGAPIGFVFHSFIEALVYKIVHVFKDDFSIMAAAFITPLLIVTLGLIPIFFLARRFAGNVAGFFAAFIAAVHPALMTRTVAGFSDTDAWHFFLPITAVWLFFEGIYAKNKLSKYSLFSASGLVIGLHSTFWTGWWYTFDFLVAVAGVALVYNLIVKEKIEWKKSIYSLVSLIASTAVFGAILNYFFKNNFSIGFSNIWKALIVNPIKFIQLKAVASVTLWPNVKTTVAELNPTTFGNVIKSSGIFLFLFAIIGIILILIKKNKNDELDIKPGVLLIVWFIATLYASVKSLRFSALFVPGLALASGCFAGIIFSYAAEWFNKGLNLNKLLSKTILVIVLIPLMLIAPLNSGLATAKSEMPSMDDAWYNSLTAIKEDSTNETIITSWWDFGHWFKAVAERPVTFDGGDQGRRIYWVGKSLLVDDEKESIGILNMLNCDQNNAFNKTEKYTGNDTVRSIDILTKLTKVDESEARAILESEGFTNSQINDVINSTHCKPWAHYYITSGDMIGKANVWAHFGSWDFQRANMYNKVRKIDDVNEGVRVLVDEFNLSEDKANTVYFEIQTTEADRWIAPWPGYLTGWKKCSEKDFKYSCDILAGIGSDGNSNVIVRSVNIKGKNVSFDIAYQDKVTKSITGTANVNPAGLVTLGENGFTKISFSDVGLAYDVLFDKENSRVLIADPDLSMSVFTQLYFLKGRYNEYFELFRQDTTLTGQEIYIWKVSWDGTADNTKEKITQVKASHILVTTDNRTDFEVVDFLGRIYKNLTPDNFAEYAEKYSEGPSAVNGGSLGWFSRGMMVENFENAAFDTEVGEIAGPIKTQFGYHLILVEDKK